VRDARNYAVPRRSTLALGMHVPAIYRVLALAVATTIMSLPSAAAELLFQGSWQQSSGDNDIFNLILIEQNGILCGFHISSVKNAARVDEAEGTPTITGVAKGRKATIEISSSWSSAVVTGTIER
jgi:hypothetical protein